MAHYLENKGFVVPIMACIYWGGSGRKIVSKLPNIHAYITKEWVPLALIYKQGVKNTINLRMTFTWLAIFRRKSSTDFFIVKEFSLLYPNLEVSVMVLRQNVA
jgi:hypothetical protein